MKLTRVTVEGYKRFGAETSLDIDGDVVALVGPNEAGKTSLLQALVHLNDNDEIPASELNRARRPAQDSGVVSARFLLEPDDLQALADIPEASSVRWYTLIKTPAGGRRIKLTPRPARDTTSRRALAVALDRATRHKGLAALFDDDANELEAETFQRLAIALGTEDEDLEEGLSAEMRELATQLSETMPSPLPKYLTVLPAQLEKQASEEETPNPRGRAAKALASRRPEFRWFGEAERDLASSYELTELPDERPVALVNLTRLANIGLEELVEAAVEDRTGELQELRDRGNRRLRSFFAEHWQQAGLTVELTIAGTELQLFVREDTGTEGTGTYWHLEERSDGLRWFVALVGYLQSETVSVPPILLIDEAEQHLHYDGQADLVRAFERQEAVESVIYTTHSAGCLPQDLGTGVRVISRNTDGTSAVFNSLWTPEDLSTGTTFSGLLMRMGASTFAFAATRYAVICEGISEVILLPTLFREATGEQALPFQLAPGLANVARQDVPNLELAASSVAFLVDADAAGKAIAKKLRLAGADQSRIVRLIPGQAVRTLEDLVDPDELRLAVNAELARSRANTEMPRRAMSATRRYGSVERWCARQHPPLEPPPKAAVARQIIRAAREGRLVVQASRAREIQELYGRIVSALGLVA